MLNSKKINVLPGEAQVFLRRTFKSWFFNSHYRVQLSNDPLPQFWGEPVDVSEHVVLGTDGDTASFTPASIAMENGMISLQKVTLNLANETARSSDGVPIHYRATAEFHLVENKAWLVKLLTDGILKSLGSTFASRCRSEISSKISTMEYRHAIEHQQKIRDDALASLRLSVEGSPMKSKDRLGVMVSNLSLQVDGKQEVNQNSEEATGPHDFDMANKARRLYRFIDKADMPDQLKYQWVAERLDSLVSLDRVRAMANSRATVVFSDTGMSNVTPASIGELVDIPLQEREGPGIIPSTDENILPPMSQRALAVDRKLLGPSDT